MGYNTAMKRPSVSEGGAALFEIALDWASLPCQCVGLSFNGLAA